jgi:hypothetical protein
MRPGHLCVWLFSFGMMSAGCATTVETSRRFALIKPERIATKPTTEDLTAKSNPPRQTAEVAKTTAPNGRIATDASQNAGPGKEPVKTGDSAVKVVENDAAAAGKFNSETLNLIDAELADASAEERSYWFSQLKLVDPALIPKILQARRLTAHIAQRRQRDSSVARTNVREQSTGPENLEGGPQHQEPDWTRDGSSAIEVVRRTVPGGTADLNQTLQESDGLSVRRQILQQGYTAPNSAPTNPPGEAPQNSETPAAPTTSSSAAIPGLATSRMALSRLLPTSRNGAVAQASANNPSAVSLMPPEEITPASWESRLASLISLVEADVAQLTPGSTEQSRMNYIQRHVDLRLLYLMAEHPERALTAIPGIDAADQEFWQ